MTLPPSSSTVGFALSGGAARGAYEAGVLRFVHIDLAKRLGRPTWPTVVSGTSVGAINGVFAAARDADAVTRLSAIWQSLTIEKIYCFFPLKTARRAYRWGDGDPFGLLDPSPLNDLVARNFPSASLRAAIDGGATRAFVVSATDVHTGENVLFVDGNVQIDPLPGSRTYAVKMADIHCRASGAIPFLFPPVVIDGRYYVDGGLRQNTPIRPVVRSGVGRAIVISLKQARDLEAEQPRPGTGTPSLWFLAGKMMNALLLDPIERDLWSANHYNDVARWGARNFGAEFTARATVDLGLRDVEILHVRPTEDLGRMAGSIYRARPPTTDRGVRFLLDRVAERTEGLEADFLSYLYFDRAYTGALEALGYEDASKQEEGLANVFRE